jgi:hypothetical protein
MGSFGKMRLILIFIITTVSIFASIDDLIQIIKTPRTGASDAQIKATPNPFEYINDNGSTNITKIEPRFELQAIFDAQALINNRWVKLGATIDGYKLLSLDAKSATLQSGKNSKTIYLNSRTTY